MDQRSVRWLYQQLPALVEKGVVAPETAEALRQHYGPLPERNRLLVFGLLGGGLIGLGIILLIANNWEMINRGWRLALSITLLLIAQGIAILAQKNQLDLSWVEGAALFWAAMTGVTIALVSQTYHLSEDTGAFLLTWLLLVLPVAYLLNSAMVAAAFAVLATVWAGTVHWSGDDWWVWGLYLLLGPLVWRLWRQEDWSGRLAFAIWVLSLALLAALAITGQRWLHSLAWLVFGAFLLRYRWESYYVLPEDTKFYSAPRRIIGTGGLFALLFILSFRGVWYDMAPLWKAAQGEWLLLGGVLALLAPYLWLVVRGKRWGEGWYAAGLLVMALGYPLVHWWPSGLPSVVAVNLYLLVFCGWQLVNGYRAGKQTDMNLALLLLGVVVLARFFDAQVSFIMRGLAFIVLGVGFLLINRCLLGKGGGKA